MTTPPSTHRLIVPGAQLYYEIRGSGPLLLVIGQPMTSAAFGPLADLLAEHRTVVTYDPRGLGQSTVEDPSLDVTPEVQADDLAQLVDAVGGGPTDVLASSGGAVAGLALAARHPDRVANLVAHEPPVTELLPDAPHVRAAVDDIEDAYRSGGSEAAWGKFVSLVVHDGPVPEAGVPLTTWPPEDADADTADTAAAEAGQQVPDVQDAAAPPVPQRTAKDQADDELFFLRNAEAVHAVRADCGRAALGPPAGDDRRR